MSISPSDVYNYPVLIREHHLDTLGHMNNATYLELFEEARWELLETGGYGMGRIKVTGLGPIILEITIKFTRELKLRESITVQTWCDHYTGKIGLLTQTMMLPNGEEAARAIFTFGLFDLKARKLVPPTTEWLRLLKPRAIH